MSHARQLGFTWIELCVLFCVLGSVSAIFIPTFCRSVETSKKQEAVTNLDRIRATMLTYFERTKGCLPGSATPFPEKPSMRPRTLAFDFGKTKPEISSWQALQVHLKMPIRFRYSVMVSMPGCNATKMAQQGHAPLITYLAEGDLDGDGKYSRYERIDQVSPKGALQPVGILKVENPIE